MPNIPLHWKAYSPLQAQNQLQIASTNNCEEASRKSSKGIRNVSVATDCRRWRKVIPAYVFGRHGMPPILFFARTWFGGVGGFDHYSLLIAVHWNELKWVYICSVNGTGIQQTKGSVMSVWLKPCGLEWSPSGGLRERSAQKKRRRESASSRHWTGLKAVVGAAANYTTFLARDVPQMQLRPHQCLLFDNALNRFIHPTNQRTICLNAVFSF